MADEHLATCAASGFGQNVINRSVGPMLSAASARRGFARMGVPKDLEHFWLGHADEEVGDIYSKLKDDVAFRQEVTRRIGYGFELLVKERVVGPNGPKIKAESVQEVAVTV